MAIAPHADDIEFYAGGTLLKYHDLGYEIDYVMSSNNMSGTWKVRQPDGSLVREDPCWDRMAAKRREEAIAAAAVVGTEPVFLDHPQRTFRNAAGKLVELRYGCEQPGAIGPDVPTLLTAHEHAEPVKEVADLIISRNPEAVLVHGMIEFNPEHVATCLLVTKAYWQAVEKGYQGMLLHWHNPGVGLFGDAYLRWDTHIDVTDVWQRKLDWIAVHACMVPNPQETEYFSKEVVRGCGQAEAFNIVARGNRYYENTPFEVEIRKNSVG